MTVLAFLTVLALVGITFPSFCLSYKMQYEEATAPVLTVLAVVAVSVVTATALNSIPPLFRHPERKLHEVKEQNAEGRFPSKWDPRRKCKLLTFGNANFSILGVTIPGHFLPFWDQNTVI